MGTEEWESAIQDDGGAAWRQAHHALTRIARKCAALDAEESRWLVIARRERVHVQLGYATLLEYLERTLGYAPVTRIATPETERVWLDAVEGKTVRECETLVRGRARGDRPTDPAKPELVPRRWSVELAPDVYAGVLEARRRLEEEIGGQLDDNGFVAALCERALRGGAASSDAASSDGDRVDEIRVAKPAYQIALTVCAQCDRATQDASGQVIDVAPSVVERARCDAEYIGRLDAETPARVKTDIPPATRRWIWRRDHGRCTVPGCRSAKRLEIHHLVPREAGGDHAVSNLTLLCEAHHRAHQDGLLAIRGTAPDRLLFEHRDGRRYGSDFFAQAKSALRTAGFSAAVADAAIERARAHVSADVRLEDLLRACFRECPRPSA